MHLNCDSLKNLKIFNFEGSGKYSSSYYNVIFLGILWRQLLPRKTRQEIAITHRFFARSDNNSFEFQSNICFRRAKTRLFPTKLFRNIFEYIRDYVEKSAKNGLLLFQGFSAKFQSLKIPPK